jgi:hypothetical protein
MFGRMLRIGVKRIGVIEFSQHTLIEPKCALGIEADTGRERNACRAYS